MIKNKNQFIKAIKENKDKILIKRIYNLNKDNKIKENSLAKITYIQSNSIKIKYDTFDKELWLYFNNYEFKDNKIYCYGYVTNNQEKQAKEIAKKRNIELIPIDRNDKINNNKYSNIIYTYKYIEFINEIIEID